MNTRPRTFSYLFTLCFHFGMSGWKEALSMVGIYRAISITQIFKTVLNIEHKSSPM